MLRIKNSSLILRSCFRTGFASLDSGSGKKTKYPEKSRLTKKDTCRCLFCVYLSIYIRRASRFLAISDK